MTPDLSWIATAPETDLRKHLLTCDGRGARAKEAMLDELIRRARVAVYTEIDIEDRRAARWDP